MIANSLRDNNDIRRQNLLEDYFDRWKAHREALCATALRTRSTSMRDILATGALGTGVTSEELKCQLFTRGGIADGDINDVGVLADLGRVVLLQNLFEDDELFGETLLSLCAELDPKGEQMSMRNRRVLIQHQIVNGRVNDATRLLDEFRDVDKQSFGYLRAELQNPFTVGIYRDKTEWLASFNQAFIHYGLAPIQLSDDESLRPFDRLGTPQVMSRDSQRREETVLVSVVLTAFRPDRERIMTSVESVLTQTWENLELIIVDDCSGPDYAETFRDLASLDKRVVLIQNPTNQGTYLSRNIGYAAAKGNFITGQDDDDWSHPERLERQLDFMHTNTNAIGCRVTAIRCDENLGRVRVGSLPHGQNASSLLIRREAYDKVGGYLPARKAADSEYHFRVEKATGRPVQTLREPLSVIRILQGSLSRGDFGPGWKHSARRSFRSAYEYWHKTSAPEQLYLSGDLTPEVEIPWRYRINSSSEGSSRYDFVFAGCWESSGRFEAAMLEEVRALVEANYRVAIMNLESGRYIREPIQKSLVGDIQSLINKGIVDEVFYDDRFLARLLILRDPSVLQFLTDLSSSGEVQSMLIVADDPPCNVDGSGIRYCVEDCHKNAENAFGVSPKWIPADKRVRQFFQDWFRLPNFVSADMPKVMDIRSWWHDRYFYRSTSPVVGRHSFDQTTDWPSDSRSLAQIYPTDGRFDVRIFGRADAALDVLDIDRYPATWLVYGPGELSISDFLYSLDYFVFYPNEQAQAVFDEIILNALAAGVVVILPKEFEPFYGNAAVYAEAAEVENVVTNFHQDFSEYRIQLEKTRSVLEDNFSYKSYRSFIEAFLVNERNEKL